MEKAKQRQKEGIVKPQVVAGREFKGTSFISKPERIVFKVSINITYSYKDFTVGIPHTLTILVTNVSFSFNSFKLLPLNDNIKVSSSDACGVTFNTGLLSDSVHSHWAHVCWSLHSDHDHLHSSAEPGHHGRAASAFRDGTHRHPAGVHLQEGSAVGGGPRDQLRPSDLR